MIPFLDLPAQYRAIRGEIDKAIGEVLESSQFILGSAVEGFEREFARYCGAKHAIGVNSGTSALHLALLALGIGRGDEVVVPAHTFVATAAAVTYTGATPVLVDVDPERFTMSPEKLEQAITPRTRAIVPVHLYGQPADMTAIQRIAERAGVPIVEDAAQAHGAKHQGRDVGGIGSIGCFSFYPGKNLGAYGEAGGVVTNDDRLAAKMAAMRDWGQVQRSSHTAPAFNYRMDGIQGAVLGVKIRHIEKWTSERQRVARRYDELFAAGRMAKSIRLPRAFADGTHVYHQYVIRVWHRDALRSKLQARGIQTGIHYPLPIHLQPMYAGLGHAAGSFPQAERIVREIVSLPIYPELADGQIREVVAATEDAVEELGS